MKKNPVFSVPLIILERLAKIVYLLRGRRGEPAVFNFDVHLAEHCNLNCASCTHFSTLAEKKFYDTERFEKDIKRMAEITRGGVNIGFVTLDGGEPLLNPDVIRYFEIVRRHLPDVTIKLLTNGTLLSRQPEEFWEAAAAHNITVNVTAYPVPTDFAAIDKLAERYGLTICYHNRISFFGIKINAAWKKVPISPDGRHNAARSYALCNAVGCCQLVDGRLYPCARIAYIDYFNSAFNQNLSVSGQDYIDIYKINDAKEITAFIAKPYPFCRYCDTANSKNIKWATSKKSVSEWI